MSKPIEPVYRQLGAKIEAMRTVLGWSQDDFAKKVGLSRGSVANIETGRQRILLHDVDNFAAAFNCKVSILMRGIWT